MTAIDGSAGGRPQGNVRRLPPPVPAPRPTVGLDIGGTKTLAALLAPDGEVLAQARLTTQRGPQAVLAVAARAVEGVVRQAGLDVAALDGVGVGVPGLVGYDDGTVRHAVNLGIEGAPMPLARLLGERLGVGVVVDNDLNVAALGAAHLAPEAASRPLDLAFLALGTGLAAGLVLDGVVRRGTGAAGEIGHVPIDPAGPLCPCGQRGCLELYASGTAVERLWPTTTGQPAPVELLAAVTAGDPAARAVWDAYADAVAAAVRMLVLSVDVRHVVLGGGVAQLGAPLLDAVQAALTRQAARSPFLASLTMADRVLLAPGRVPVAAVGAAVLARSTSALAVGPLPAAPRQHHAAAHTPRDRAGEP
ncbi:ROK family protein [Xylanimonas cellulosilytica DSM 15894]|uniref:ROK family protein n=1 Tax=Xylanimonas cellulosilytica (strain DSM 15894 / JCM 12276 / CECT 5975 / KCTC 9989 / LMG 20990 / NBRC 107835 / XIL07) TaxID=446471 RepID=D1BZ04_XYLCX|nr:ROK family protein [Xylanimonas cellulosilytica]ACZ30079.1 ROK family protein [Xylanimonas cellulosilytica DSM 15894]